MSEYEREFGYDWAKLSLFVGLFNFILFLIPIIFSPNFLESNKFDYLLLILSLTFLGDGICIIIFNKYAKTRYEENPSNELCDLCGEIVEKIKLRSYIYSKIILCKKCHKKHYIFTIIIVEIILLASLFIFYFWFYSSVDRFYAIFVPSLLIGLVIGAPLISIYQIRKY